MNIRSITYNLLNFFAPLFQILNKNRLKVLAYHTVPDPFTFEKQLRYLKSNHTVIDLVTLKNHLFYKQPLPKNPVLITFDDGDISVFENGLPVLKKLDLPAVLFIITDLIDTNNTFWCRQVEKVFQKNGKSYLEARKQVNHLKNIPEKERMAYLHNLEEVFGRQMSSKQLRFLNQNKIIVANHSHTHPMFNNCTFSEISKELEKTRTKFQEWGIGGYETFAYPNGNYNSTSEEALKENNIEVAFLFDHKINKKNINPLRISRIRVDTNTALPEFKVKISGFHSILMNLKL